MKFSYLAYDKSGKELRGAIEASDSNDAQEQLRRQGCFVVEMHATEARGMAVSGMETYSLGVSLKASSRLEKVAMMLRQLSLLVSTGTPVVDALVSLERQTPKGEWRDVIAQVRAKVEEGKSLSEAMSSHPVYFDSVCRSLVAAGEAGGNLDAMLDRLSMLTRQQLRIRKSISGALVYPILLIFVAFGVTGAMVGFVLPRFKGLFKTLDTALPPLTSVLMSVSDAARAHWIELLVGVVLGTLGAFAFFRTKKGKRAADEFLVRAPVIGKVYRAFFAARIARLLGTLLQGKVPMVEALALTRYAVKNSLYVELMVRAEDVVVRGDPLSAALGDPKLITPSVTEAIRSGERSGQLAPVLTSVADFLDEDNEVAIRTLTGLLEPVILIFMGLVVGTVAISMMLPLFDLTAAGGNR